MPPATPTPDSPGARELVGTDIRSIARANGRAVDVNPRENPWMDLRCDCWSSSARHAARTPGPGKVRKGGMVWRAFTEEGWVWQNIDVPGYMYFDTGYPSRPYRRPQA
jgi:hypothetical protein